MEAEVEQAPPPTQSDHIWIYEWDLYEPYFSRNWTFTYNTSVIPGFEEHMSDVATDANRINNWMPTLTKIPELPSPYKRLPQIKQKKLYNLLHFTFSRIYISVDRFWGRLKDQHCWLLSHIRLGLMFEDDNPPNNLNIQFLFIKFWDATSSLPVLLIVPEI